MLIYPVYRRRQGLDLTTTHKVAVERSVVEHEAEYESVLVALDAQAAYSHGAIATAAKLAARRRRGIHVLVYIAVPQSSPIDAELPEAEQAAEAIIEQARLQGGRRVTGHIEKVRAGRGGADDRRRGARAARPGDRRAAAAAHAAARCSARRWRPCSPSARAA